MSERNTGWKETLKVVQIRLDAFEFWDGSEFLGRAGPESTLYIKEACPALPFQQCVAGCT
ncbi:hypothetical protein L484_013082 [Morus notabilis]|uniref:Uncharacterized protein n=1 Tax=Morus notabilis TaxID=981085 RepID=W9R1N7_9ROSA|nr:hypothetical protein L484_013082 [Morus notabilis]